MKKILFALLIFAEITLHAQMQFGAKGGYNLSSMKWEVKGFDDYKFASQSYFYVGALAERKLSEKVSLQAEFLYTQLGGKNTEKLTTIVGNEVLEIGTNTTKIATSQVQVPVSAKYYVNPSFSLSAGLNFGFNISSKVTNSFVSDQTPNGNTNLFKTVNIFPFLGTEYKIDPHFFADARYHFNFFNAAIQDAPPTKISFLQVGISYRFK